MSKSKKIRHLFDKKIDFENNDTFELPDEVYNCPKWSIPSFQNGKKELNRTKSLLNQFDLEEWSRHTKHRDPSSYIIRFVKKKFQPELVTQAWCKFYECLCNYSLIPKEALTERSFSSVHLCEAPGAFISALNHYIATHNLDLQWQWHANTLNPDYEGNSLEEMIPDDRLLRHTYKNWYFGVDFSGNITKYYNHTDLLQKIGYKVWLVTADGSVDCSSDPGNQESHVEYLHYCETLTSLALLKTGGNFVLKIFTMFEDSTICLLYLLNVVFRKVSIFKPASSKSGNSEVYVICLDYKGFNVVEREWGALIAPYKNGHFDPDKSMFDLNKINKDFLNQLLCISEYFMKKQIEQISDNISHFRNVSHNESGKIHQVKVYIANRFINKYKLKSIPQHCRLVSAIDISQFFLSNDTKKFKFDNGVVKFDVKNLIPISVSSGILDVKLGQLITHVRSSRFCTTESLEKFNDDKKIKSNGHLYHSIRKKLEETSTVITSDECHNQKQFFYSIYDSNRSNFVIVGIPFLTNFLVGVMYILISLYEQVYLHKSGFIVLHGKQSFKNKKHIFDLINETYRSANECKLFDCDIVQAVSPNLFYNNNFFDFIWNYNNIVLSKL